LEQNFKVSRLTRFGERDRMPWGGRSCRREQLPHRSSSQFIIDTLALAAGEEFVLLICTSEF